MPRARASLVVATSPASVSPQKIPPPVASLICGELLSLYQPNGVCTIQLT